MCHYKAYTERYPDGHRDKAYRYEVCAEKRMGLPCAESTSSSHSRASGYTNSPAYTYAEPYFPPTPSYTPAMSSTPTYPNGYESDMSYHSNGSGGPRRRRRGSSASHYPADAQYLDANTIYRPRDVPRRSNERVVIVENPPTPRTPPQSHNFAQSAPSSPRFGQTVSYTTESSPLRRETTRTRPIIVYERPRPQVKIVEPSPERSSKSHSRNTSTDSGSYYYTHSIPIPTNNTAAYASSPSQTKTKSSSPSSDAEKAMRQREEMARHNAEINARRSVPRPLKRSTTSYSAANPAFAAYTSADAADDMARLSLTYEQRREESERRRMEKMEQDAMDARLRERLMPKRRFSVGTGTRRRRMDDDEGLYRYD